MRIRRDTPKSAQRMRKFLDFQSIPVDKYLTWQNHPILSDFFILNPRWNMREWADLIIENKKVILNQ